MTHSTNYSKFQTGSPILISIKPRFVDLILAGSKTVELRRTIPKQSVNVMVIYSSAPTQAIVALVPVVEIIEASVSRLWDIARDNGGGLRRHELREYFSGKKTGFAIMLGPVRRFDIPIDPKAIFKKFTPPQSFLYLNSFEMNKIEKILSKKKE